MSNESSLVSQYTQIARSKSTNDTYGHIYRVWDAWCDNKGIASVPVASNLVAEYLAEHADRYKVATLNTHLSAIATLHKMNGYPSPCSLNDEPVRSVYQGIRRKNGIKQRRANALLFDDIKAICDILDDSMKGVRDKAILLVGFAAALRRGEIGALHMDDLTFTDDGLILNVNQSKSDQMRKGVDIGIVYGASEDMCPVTSLRHWIEVSGIVSGYIFRKVTRHGTMSSTNRPLSGSAISNMVKEYAAAIGYDPDEFSGHSLRSGFITEAAMRGAAVTSIMGHARQRSLRDVRRYIRHANVLIDSPTASVFG